MPPRDCRGLEKKGPVTLRPNFLPTLTHVPGSPSLQSAAPGGQADGPGDLVPVIGVPDGEAHSILFDLNEGGQGLGDVLGGAVQWGSQAFRRHSLHLGR